MHIRENQLGMLFRQKGNQQLVGVLIQDFSRFEKKSNCCVQKRFNTLDMPIMSACQLVLCTYASAAYSLMITRQIHIFFH